MAGRMGGAGWGGGRGPHLRPWLGPTWGAAHWTPGSRSRRFYLRVQGQQVSVSGPAIPRHFRLL